MSDSPIVMNPTRLAEWKALVDDAHDEIECALDDELKGYLVGTLIRYTDRADIADSVMAFQYLEAQLQSGALRSGNLQQVGDQCLIFAGLFPGRARRRMVRTSYFVDIGRSAYQNLADAVTQKNTEVFARLSSCFVGLMDVLLTMREMGGNGPSLDPVCAYELWSDTGSKHAWKTLRGISGGLPGPGHDGLQ